MFQARFAEATGKADADAADVLAAGPDDDRPNPEDMAQGGCALGDAPRPLPWTTLLLVVLLGSARRRRR
jgi:MYXO-CTERM domain-containing protein